MLLRSGTALVPAENREQEGSGMPGRKNAVVGTLVAIIVLLLGVTPAAARPARAADEAIDVAEACPRYLSLSVASIQEPGLPEPVIIQVYSPPEEFEQPEALILERALQVREVEPDLHIRFSETDSDIFGFHGRAVMRWDDQYLSPGTRIAVGTSESNQTFAEATISKRCDTPDLRMTKVRVKDNAIVWRVKNPTSEEVWFNAQVLGTRPAEVHIGPVPPNGKTTFETSRRRGLNIVLLFVGGKLVDLDLAIVR